MFPIAHMATYGWESWNEIASKPFSPHRPQIYTPKRVLKTKRQYSHTYNLLVGAMTLKRKPFYSRPINFYIDVNVSSWALMLQVHLINHYPSKAHCIQCTTSLMGSELLRGSVTKTALSNKHLLHKTSYSKSAFEVLLLEIKSWSGWLGCQQTGIGLRINTR